MAINILLSYAFHKTRDMSEVRRAMVCGRVLLDSGAYTAWKTGKPVKLAEYAEFLDTWRNCYDHAVTLDVVGDPAATAVHTRKLHERGIPVMPVFTRNAPIADFDAMIRDTGYVCIGGLIGLPMKVVGQRLTMLQRRATELGGGIHALGVGALKYLRWIHPYSADSSRVDLSFVYGNLVYFTGRELRNCPVWNRKRMTQDWKYIRASGVQLGAIADAGRLPAKQARRELCKAQAWAYAAADEYARSVMSTPAPATVKDDDGPHLYSACTSESTADATMEIEAILHSDHPVTPPVWRMYGKNHTCRVVRP